MQQLRDPHEEARSQDRAGRDHGLKAIPSEEPVHNSSDPSIQVEKVLV